MLLRSLGPALVLVVAGLSHIGTAANPRAYLRRQSPDIQDQHLQQLAGLDRREQDDAWPVELARWRRGAANGAPPPSPAGHPGCKCFPGDRCWPRSCDWSRLNATVNGRLIATVPLGSPCHDPHYNGAECAKLRGQWLDSPVQ